MSRGGSQTSFTEPFLNSKRKEDFVSKSEGMLLLEWMYV